MTKSKSEMMRVLYDRRRAAGLVRISFWIPEKMQQLVKDTVAGVISGKKAFWKK